LSFRSAAEESAFSSRCLESGFTLIELLIVMSIMLILMALAVPQMLKLKKHADETTSAQVLDPVLAATGQKSGYTFTITCGTKVTINNQDVYNSYEVTGVPQSVGKTGDNGYCSDENNIVKIDPTGATNCTQSLQ
jgi:type IV pilus assembly protein PilA